MSQTELISGTQWLSITFPSFEGNWWFATRDPVNKGMAAMLVEQTKEVLEETFVYVHQHGGDDVT